VLVFTLVLFSRSHGQNFGQLLFLTAVNAIFFLGYAYLMIFVIIPFFLPEKKYLLFAISSLGIGFLLSILKLTISDFIFYSSISPEFIGSKGLLNVRFVLINTKDMSFIVALFVVAKFTKDWLIAENQHKGLERKYAELKLRLLQRHFEPHFLFNTLNNLYALSLTNQDKTLDVIQRFRRVLQFSISEAQKPQVPVSGEMEMIEDFIRIEQIRYGDRLKVESTITGSCANLMISPFMLFTLVENCFKHGSSTDAGQPWIKLSLNCENDRICFEAKNSIPRKCHRSANFQEKGLSKLRQRLQLIYPKKYSLTLKEEPLEFVAKLELDLN
jgi:two-component system, LytTR family, sensor kinase